MPRFQIGPDESESSGDDSINIDSGSRVGRTSSTAQHSHIAINDGTRLSTSCAPGPSTTPNGHLTPPGDITSGAQTPEHRRWVNADDPRPPMAPRTPSTEARFAQQMASLPALSTNSVSHTRRNDSQTGLALAGIERDPQPSSSMSVPAGARAPHNSVASAQLSDNTLPVARSLQPQLPSTLVATATQQATTETGSAVHPPSGINEVAPDEVALVGASSQTPRAAQPFLSIADQDNSLSPCLEATMLSHFDPATQPQRSPMGTLNPVVSYDYPSTVNPTRFRQIAEAFAEEHRGVSPRSRLRSPPPLRTGQEAIFYGDSLTSPGFSAPSMPRRRHASVVQTGGMVEMRDRTSLRRPSQFTPLPHRGLAALPPAAQSLTTYPRGERRRSSTAPSATPSYFRDEAHQPQHVRFFEEQQRGRQLSATPNGRRLSSQMRQARASLVSSWRWQARIYGNPEINAAREVIRQQDDEALKRRISNATRRDSTKPAWG